VSQVGSPKFSNFGGRLFAAEIDWHAHPGSFDVKVDVHSSSSIEYINKLHHADRSFIG
jgi:hypothetical protein